MSCSDTHCFPHSKNGRRDFEDSDGSDVADAVTNAINEDEHPGLPGASNEAEIPASQFKATCVNNTDCSSNEVCSRGHCTLKVGRCWETRDCNRRQHCINTFCYPPGRVSRRASADEAIPTTPAPLEGSDESVIDQTEEIETDDDMDVSPIDQDTLLNLVTTAGKKGNKCRRRCRYHTDCCPGDACWNMRICLGPHKGG
ncbi:uncharacterized protein LDX57_004981 [Aspergillus melleus]|uniref:uncharacterized protein n=1 Tax=Aspergillus melleus TaxID=138277 RepID=UPI001E8CE5E3|nr:uncharacterized protein LDX57_004981 [Aspergillus melleus]KAH8427268.1 hypothetical protein LDX57_004981 [Aspergillus melleus]